MSGRDWAKQTLSNANSAKPRLNGRYTLLKQPVNPRSLQRPFLTQSGHMSIRPPSVANRMKSISPRIIAALAALTVPPPTWSESEGFYFDCDVPSGSFSEWHGPTEPATTVRVSGTVEVVKLRNDKRWWPIGSIFLKDIEDEGAGLQVYVDWRNVDIFHLGLYSRGRKELAEIPLTDEPIPFEFSLTRSGEFSATIAGHSESAELGEIEVRRIVLSCSSGEFKFRNVLVQYE